MTNLPNWILLAVQVITTAVVGGIGFFLKRELNKAENLNRDFQRFRLQVAEDYVRKDDYNIAQGEIMKRLDKIQDMLIKALTK